MYIAKNDEITIPPAGGSMCISPSSKRKFFVQSEPNCEMEAIEIAQRVTKKRFSIEREKQFVLHQSATIIPTGPER